MATIGELEQWIAEIEVAITIQYAEIDRLIRHGDGVRPQSKLLDALRGQVALLRLQRRRLLMSSETGEPNVREAGALS
jgi:hypothetical protein